MPSGFCYVDNGIHSSHEWQFRRGQDVCKRCGLTMKPGECYTYDDSTPPPAPPKAPPSDPQLPLL